MRFLYDLFGYPPTKDSSFETDSFATAPLLNDALKGAKIIDEMPEVKSNLIIQGGKPSKDYEKQQKELKRIGDRGEAIVLGMEKKRLSNAKRKDLAHKIKYIAEKDDSAGFDILSYETDGTERPIEVKATKGKNLGRGFYISANELEKSKSLANYYIYFVFSVMTDQPRVLPVKKPALDVGDFKMEAIMYRVTVNTGDISSSN